MTQLAHLKSQFSINDVEILDNTECYSGFMKVAQMQLRHRLYGGGWSNVVTRDVMHRDQGVGVLLYDPELDKVLMVEQFRVGCLDDPDGPWKIELVAGLMDTDESARDIAVRESREEAGVDISTLIPVGEYYNSPGSSSEKIAVYCAGFDARRDEGVFGLDEEHEDIRTVILPRADAERAVREGIINNAMGIIAIQWLALNVGMVQTTLKGG